MLNSKPVFSGNRLIGRACTWEEVRALLMAQRNITHHEAAAIVRDKGIEGLRAFFLVDRLPLPATADLL